MNNIMKFRIIICIICAIQSCVPHRNSFVTADYKIIDDRVVAYKMSENSPYELGSISLYEDDTIFRNFTFRRMDEFILADDTLLLRKTRSKKQIEFCYLWNQSLRIWQFSGSRRIKSKGIITTKACENKSKWVSLNP
jgi:hypothetical protein